MKAFIYIGGGIAKDGIREAPKGDDLSIAADRGYENALALGVTPEIAVGDFDSMDQRKLPRSVECIPVLPEKDYTDTALAISVALERGVDEFVFIGGLDGRLDHTLANLSQIERLGNAGIRAIITDGRNRVRYLKASSELLPVCPPFRYFSLIPVDEKVKGVTVEGGKYPLKNATLTRDNTGFSVSNEIEKNVALISVRKGRLFIVESRDA